MSVVITNASGKPGSGAHRLPKIVIEEVADERVSLSALS
jgi:hypothetical protein